MHFVVWKIAVKKRKSLDFSTACLRCKHCAFIVTDPILLVLFVRERLLYLVPTEYLVVPDPQQSTTTVEILTLSKHRYHLRSKYNVVLSG